MPKDNKPRHRVQAGVGDVNKVSNIDMPTSRLRLGDRAFGYEGLRAIQNYVDQEMVQALRWPKSLETFDKMCYDPSVSIGLYLSQILVEKAFTQPNVKFNKDSEESKEAAAFVNWCLNNMQGSLQQAVRDAYTFKKYGFSVLVKSFELATSGKYKGRYKLKKLSARSQKTLNKSEPFVIGNNDVVTHVRQDTKSQGNTFGLFNPAAAYNTTTVNIPRDKFMLFSFDSTNGNPLGSSPLRPAYKAWREKVMIEDYQVVGTSKDLGGYRVATKGW